MNNISITKNPKNQIEFDYGEGKKVLVFDNIKEYAKKVILLDAIDAYAPTIVCDQGLDLYKATIEELITSLKTDSELISLVKSTQKQPE